jgi:CheY-like chemotaxis protein
VLQYSLSLEVSVVRLRAAGRTFSVAKILVADDNSNIQKMVGLALKDQGIDVVAVGNGEAAVRKISDVHPDLVLADVFMPVRNGYEVCRYVKEDSSLSHIPVILLVGAFDPLDEQEAQRVGADGVLKKPFVPPDPLISMVKSALTRAGVSLTPAPLPPPTDRPPVPLRLGQDIIGGPASTKYPSGPAPSQKLPEAFPEPVEEFAAPAEQVKIEGTGPVAFGNLLDSAQEPEEDLATTAKPMIELAKDRDWDQEEKDVPEEGDEEESARGGWHPAGLDEAAADAVPSKAQPDWRDEAFHGSSPAKNSHSSHWTPTKEKTEIEPAQPETVAVPAVDAKPVHGTSPFLSDAWASKMAAGVEEKLAHEEEVAKPPAAVEPQQEPAAPPSSNGSGAGLAASFKSLFESAAPVIKKPVGEAPLPAVPETSWETEAKRAASLASAWDAPPSEPPAAEVPQPVEPAAVISAAPVVPETPAPSPDETQDVPVYASEPAVEEPVVPPVDEGPQSSAYSGHFEVEHEEAPAPPVEAQAPVVAGRCRWPPPLRQELRRFARRIPPHPPRRQSPPHPPLPARTAESLRTASSPRPRQPKASPAKVLPAILPEPRRARVPEPSHAWRIRRRRHFRA